MARKRNLTLALDEELIVKARVIAARRRTSLTSLVRRSIEDLVTGDELQAQARRRLKAGMREPAFEVGQTKWSREELHDRPQFH